MKLIPVVVQDVRTNNVLMLAYTNRETLRLTRRTGYMHYWSRSRNRVWKKGEESGHVQKVVSLHFDCDRDTILARVEQTGPACHRGTPTCFGRRLWPARGVVDDLWRLFGDQRGRPRKGVRPGAPGPDPEDLRGKVLEKACDLVAAARSGRRARIAEEAADLAYHVLRMLHGTGVSPADVERILEERRKGMVSPGGGGSSTRSGREGPSRRG